MGAGEPPYDNFAQSGPLPAQPDARCAGTVGKVSSPTWSPRSDAIAFALESGVYAMPAGDIAATCDGLCGALVAPGGSDPDWGPAAVDMSQAPAAPAAPAAGVAGGAGRGAHAARRVDHEVVPRGPQGRCRDRAPRRRHATVHGLRAGARDAEGQAGKRLVGQIRTAGKPGANEQQVTGRVGGRTLTRGRYELVVAAADLTGREHASAKVKFRIRR